MKYIVKPGTGNQKIKNCKEELYIAKCYKCGCEFIYNNGAIKFDWREKRGLIKCPYCGEYLREEINNKSLRSVNIRYEDL